MTTDQQAVLDKALEKLTVKSEVTVNRAEGDVFIDGELVIRILDENPNVMEDFADTLWTHVQDLRAEAAGFTNG